MSSSVRLFCLSSVSALALVACEPPPEPDLYKKADLLTTVVSMTPDDARLSEKDWEEFAADGRKGVLGAPFQKAVKACIKLLQKEELIPTKEALIGPDPANAPENRKFAERCAGALFNVAWSVPPPGHILLKKVNDPEDRWPTCLSVRQGDARLFATPWSRTGYYGDSNLPLSLTPVSPEERKILFKAGFSMQKLRCASTPLEKPSTPAPEPTDVYALSPLFIEYMQELDYLFDYKMGVGVEASMDELVRDPQRATESRLIWQQLFAHSLNGSINNKQWSTDDLAPIAVMVRSLMKKHGASNAGLESFNGERSYANQFMEPIWTLAPRTRYRVFPIQGIYDTMAYLHSQLPQAQGEEPVLRHAFEGDEKAAEVLRWAQRLLPHEKEMFREFLEMSMAAIRPWVFDVNGQAHRPYLPEAIDRAGYVYDDEKSEFSLRKPSRVYNSGIFDFSL